MTERKYEVRVVKDEKGKYIVVETPRRASSKDPLYEEIFQSSLELAKRGNFVRLTTAVETW